MNTETLLLFIFHLTVKTVSMGQISEISEKLSHHRIELIVIFYDLFGFCESAFVDVGMVLLQKLFVFFLEFFFSVICLKTEIIIKYPLFRCQD